MATLGIVCNSGEERKMYHQRLANVWNEQDRLVRLIGIFDRRQEGKAWIKSQTQPE
jgi:hypothetical protein